jgi:hypothetical protein
MGTLQVPTGTPTTAPAIGHTSDIYGPYDSAPTSCPAGQFIRGFHGYAGDVIDGFGVTCAPDLRAYYPGTPEYPFRDSYGVHVGGTGGVFKVPGDCVHGMYMNGLEITSAPYYGTYNVVHLQGRCATAYGVNAGLSSAPTGTTRSYRASDSRGSVKFSVLISKALDKPSSWYYAIHDLVVATGCDQSARVRGAIVVSDRRRASQRRRFGARLGGFRVDGHVFGPLASPKVRAKVRVLKGACRGEVVKFTATKSRPQR